LAILDEILEVEMAWIEVFLDVDVIANVLVSAGLCVLNLDVP
jgi:hypothetical protein